jgi:hypothetical protein
VGYWAEILLFPAALIAIKAVLVATTVGAFGWLAPGAVQLGLLLAQGSEFVFMIVAMPAVRSALGEGGWCDHHGCRCKPGAYADHGDFWEQPGSNAPATVHGCSVTR